MAQLPLKQVSWAIYVPKNDIFCNLLRWFLPIFFSQHRIKLLFWDIDGSTPTYSPKSGCECPHRWRNSLISGPDMTQKQWRWFRRKRARFLAKHGLNIEGYVGPLGALLAAFGPKISTPTEAWFRWGWILGRFWAYVGPFGGYKKPAYNFIVLRGFFWAHFGAFLGLYSLLCWAILGLCWALLAAFGPKTSTPTEAWLGWGWILGRFWAYVGPFGGYVGPFGGYVGPLLGHFRAMLGSVGGFRA